MSTNKKNRADFINFRHLFSTYLSHWYLFAISIVVFGILGYLYSRTKNPVYDVRANVLIQEEGNNLLSNFGSLGELFGSSAKVDDEIFRLTSHSIYRDVAKELGINKTHIVRTGFLKHDLAYPDFPVDVTCDPSVPDTLSTNLAFKIKVNKKGLADIEVLAKKKTITEVHKAELPATVETPYGNFTIAKTKYYPEGESVKTTISFRGYGSTAEILADLIDSDIPSRKGNVITLWVNTENPDYGCTLLNSVIATYNAHGITDNNMQTTNTLEFIEERLASIGQDLNDAEINIRKFKENNNLVEFEAEAKYQAEKRGKIEESLLTAQTKADILQMTLDFFKNPANNYSLVPVSVDEKALAEAITAYNTIVLKRIELLDNVAPENLAIKSLETQLDAMRENLRLSLQRAYDNSLVALNEIKKEHESVKGRLGQAPTQEYEYVDLRRQQEIKQQLYLFLLQRKEETSIMLANALPKGVVVDEAYVLSDPVSINSKIYILLFLLFGLMVPPVGLYLRKIIRNRFDSRTEVEDALTTPILGEMCADRSGKTLIATAENHSSAAELFRLIRSNLLFMLNNADDKVVLLTSTTSGEGKSFISINLAASLALLGKKVLLVGMDIRKPRLVEYMNIHPHFGLTQYLSTDTVKIDQLITPVPEVKGLDVITSGPIPPNPAELLASEKVDSLFAQLRTMYDFIIVDSAPVGMVSDTFTLSRISDATIYVCRINYTPLSDLKFIQDIYDENRLKKLSVVINGTTTKKSYGYGYGNDK
ncbi:MAG: polysaccharide biosynthesis tyrosine autokinase [Duncaniella sp.]|nr:polysaccharide biosynthesis tyrosine autokinase [Duncaniella sp.]